MTVPLTCFVLDDKTHRLDVCIPFETFFTRAFVKLLCDLWTALFRARRQRRDFGHCSRRGHPRLRSSARDIDAGSTVAAHDVLLRDQELSCEWRTSGVHIVAGVMTPATIAFRLWACTPAEVSHCSSRHCFLAWCLMSRLY